MSPRQRALSVSTATPRAAVTPDQSPARGEWAWLATLAPPPPPPSVWAGPAQKRASETRHPEDEERHGGRRESHWMVWEWVEDLKKSVKKESFLSNVYFCPRSNKALRWRDVKQRRRCGWDGVNSHWTDAKEVAERERKALRLPRDGRVERFPLQLLTKSNTAYHGREPRAKSWLLTSPGSEPLGRLLGWQKAGEAERGGGGRRRAAEVTAPKVCRVSSSPRFPV